MFYQQIKIYLVLLRTLSSTEPFERNILKQIVGSRAGRGVERELQSLPTYLYQRLKRQMWFISPKS